MSAGTMFEVEVRNLAGEPAAVGNAGPHTLVREARAEGIDLERVRVVVQGDFGGDPGVSSDVAYDVEVEGDAPREQLERLVAKVDKIAEIPNSLRRATPVSLRSVRAG
jgi:hypothetical protein